VLENKQKNIDMKNNIMKFLSVIVLILGPVIISLAQPLPDPSGLGPDGVLPGGGAPTLNCPIGNGYLILLALAFSYGVYKYWQMRKTEKAV
jgi:hypothetical protein